MKKSVNKKAAMEMSVGTIVTIVLSVTMLIMGMLLVRTIMCSGMALMDGVKGKMEAEVSSLFGEREFGVKCMGSTGQARPKLADDMTQEIYCIIREDSSRNYKLVVENIETISGDEDVGSWIVRDDGWEGTVGVGSQTETVMILKVPRGISKTTARIRVSEYRGGATNPTKTHTMLVDFESVGSFSRAIC